MSRARNYCFTINNWIPEDWDKLVECDFFTFLIMGKEIAPTTGTPHLQGYFEMKDGKTISAIIKKLGLSRHCIHLEAAKGSSNDNIKYCSKGTDVFTKGKPKKQGERTDLEEIKNDILNGKKVDDICLENPMLYHQYGRTLTKIEDIALRKQFRTEMTTCDWYCGPTGIGKSHIAFANFNPETHYLWKNDDNGWQDSYCGQHTVIINEFRGNITYGRLLELIDIWPTEVRRRNRPALPFVSKHIIITSPMAPYEIYHNLEKSDSLLQLKRRVKVYFKLRRNDEWERRWEWTEEDQKEYEKLHL